MACLAVVTLIKDSKNFKNTWKTNNFFLVVLGVVDMCHDLLKTVTKSKNHIVNKTFFHILWDLLVC